MPAPAPALDCRRAVAGVRRVLARALTTGAVAGLSLALVPGGFGGGFGGVLGGNGALWAQEAPLGQASLATLVADRVTLGRDGALVAEGNIEVFYTDLRLSATRIVYDRAADQLDITGPITLTDGPRTVIVADSAALSADLQRGIINSARVVLDQQMQIAAGSVVRPDARYTELNNTIASSCRICETGETPLWEIRATRIVHDRDARQLYFEGAQFRLAGVPLVYLPRLRMPDPTLERGTGFLRPELRVDSVLGVGMRVPYFIALAPDRDLTLAPTITSRESYTLEARYRQAFAAGMLEFGGALTRDKLLPGDWRGYGYARGDFGLRNDFRLSFDITAVRDREYLDRYDFSGETRLTSDLTLSRVRRDAQMRVQALHFRSLRLGDSNDVLPSRAVRASWDRRFDVPGLGGAAQVSFGALALGRTASTPVMDAATDTRGGRDLARLSMQATWRRDWVLPAGVLLGTGVDVAVDHYRIRQDAAFGDSATRVTPQAMVELRWPLMRSGGGTGASHVLEPVAQFIWARDSGTGVPNEDSVMPEFDEGNLFSFNRFNGLDGRERGRRINLGLTWTRHDPAGWSSAVTLGRVFRERDLGQFSAQSPLAGGRPDWLASVQVQTAGGLTLSNRALIDDGLSVSRMETRVEWATDRLELASSYLNINSNPAEDRARDASELLLDASYAISDFWTGKIDWRYDVAQRRAATTTLGLEYRNECLLVDMRLSRRAAPTVNAPATTQFGLNVELLGFGGATAGPARRQCRG
ncbi:LPS-assembly protein LptD [Roseicitreum antarcticum]|uniref:LPS-assembly protein LptD n=1 Tax=Roseicitreum antarcticum TaxID=564137 RepID=A0A1H2XW10_9RHOB|nr:LPS assembly protein LptD [Roseicitreum antarcticum]SDW96624.1 LPS-assembly protein [Roseicitreum antarcticum]